MGCCATTNNTLGDIANKSHLSAETDNEKRLMSTNRQKPVNDEETVNLIATLTFSLSTSPMIFPDHINGGTLFNLGVNIGQNTESNSADLIDLIKTKLNKQFETKSVQLNSAYIHLFSEITFRSDKEEYKKYCKQVHDDAVDLLSQSSLSKASKLYLKSILAWNLKGDSKYFIQLKDASSKILSKLSQPLVTEYSKLKANHDPILTLQCGDNKKYKQNKFDLSPGFIQKSVIGMSDDVHVWYGKGFFIEKTLEPLIVQQFKDMKLEEDDCRKWLDDIRNGQGMLEPSIVLRELFWRLSDRINDSFQQLMQKCFKQNRVSMGLQTEYEEDIGYRGGPIKTKSRVWSKVFRDYSEQFGFPNAYFMVQDWVRCALVCETSGELQHLFELICSDDYFGGRILRVKNGFDAEAKSEFGYRAIMINAVYKGMIVEIQLMILPFLKIRKKMHLHYKIVRAEKSNDLAQDFSNING